MLDFSTCDHKKIKCAGIGEVLFDVFTSGPKIGGAPANFAFHCMQNGLDAMAISAVGHDKLGFLARDILASNFLPALLLDSDKETGAVNVSLDADGIPSYTFLEDTAYDNIPWNETLLNVAKKLDVACFGSLAQRGTTSRSTIMSILDNMKKNSIRVFDVNLRREYYSKEIIEESLKRTEIFKCNEDELPILCNLLGIKTRTCEAFNDYLQSRNIFCFIFTEGALQSTVFLNSEISVKKTPKVEVIDSVGAGDSFTATLVSRLLLGESLKIAHERAVKIAAYVCTQKGAMPVLPEELIF